MSDIDLDDDFDFLEDDESEDVEDLDGYELIDVEDDEDSFG